MDIFILYKGGVKMLNFEDFLFNTKLQSKEAEADRVSDTLESRLAKAAGELTTDHVETLVSNIGLTACEAKTLIILSSVSGVDNNDIEIGSTQDFLALLSKSLHENINDLRISLLRLENLGAIKYENRGCSAHHYELKISQSIIKALITNKDYLNNISKLGNEDEKRNLTSIYDQQVFNILLRARNCYFEFPNNGPFPIDLLNLNARIIPAQILLEVYRDKWLGLLMGGLESEKKSLVITLNDSQATTVLKNESRRRRNPFFEFSGDDVYIFDEDFSTALSKFKVVVSVVNFGTPLGQECAPTGFHPVCPPEDPDTPAPQRVLSPALLASLKALPEAQKKTMIELYNSNELLSETTLATTIRLLKPDENPRLSLVPRGSSNLFDWDLLNLENNETGSHLKSRLLRVIDGDDPDLLNNFIFVGPPGTGKSASIFHLGIPQDEIVIIKNGNGKEDSYYNGVNRRLNAAFEKAIQQKNKVIVFDDASTLFTSRIGDDIRNHEISIVDTMLTLLESNTGILTVVNLNTLVGIDEAVLSRFGQNIVTFQNPSPDQLVSLLKNYFIKVNPGYVFTSSDEILFDGIRTRLIGMPHRLITNVIKESRSSDLVEFLSNIPKKKAHTKTIGFGGVIR